MDYDILGLNYQLYWVILGGYLLRAPVAAVKTQVFRFHVSMYHIPQRGTRFATPQLNSN